MYGYGQKSTFPRDKGKTMTTSSMESLKGLSWDAWDLPEKISDEDLKKTRESNFQKFYSFSSKNMTHKEQSTRLLPAELSHCGSYPQDERLCVSLCKHCNRGFKAGVTNIHHDCVELKAPNLKHKHSSISRPSIESLHNSQQLSEASSKMEISSPILNNRLKHVTNESEKLTSSVVSSYKASRKEIFTKSSSYKTISETTTTQPNGVKMLSSKEKIISTLASNKNNISSKITSSSPQTSSFSVKSGSKRSHRSLRLYSSSSDEEIIAIPSISYSVSPPMPLLRVQIEALVKGANKTNKRKPCLEENDNNERLPEKKTKLKVRKLHSQKKRKFINEEPQIIENTVTERSICSRMDSLDVRPDDMNRGIHIHTVNLSEEESDASPIDIDNHTEELERPIMPTEKFPVSSTSLSAYSKSFTTVSFSSSESEEDTSQSLLSVGIPSTSLVLKSEECNQITVSPSDTDVIELDSLPKLNENLSMVTDECTYRIPKIHIPELGFRRIPNSIPEEMEDKILKFWQPHKVLKVYRKLFKTGSSLRLMKKLNNFPKKELLYKWPSSNVFGKEREVSVNSNEFLFMKFVRSLNGFKSKTIPLKNALVPSNVVNEAAVGVKYKQRIKHNPFSQPIYDSITAIKTEDCSSVLTSSIEDAMVIPNINDTCQSVTESDVLRLFDILFSTMPTESQFIQSLELENSLSDNLRSSSISILPRTEASPCPEITKKKISEPNILDPFSLDSILVFFEDYRLRLEEAAESAPLPVANTPIKEMHSSIIPNWTTVTPQSIQEVAPWSKQEAAPWSKQEATPYSKQEAVPSFSKQEEPIWSKQEEVYQLKQEDAPWSKTEVAPQSKAEIAPPSKQETESCSKQEEVSWLEPLPNRSKNHTPISNVSDWKPPTPPFSTNELRSSNITDWMLPMSQSTNQIKISNVNDSGSAMSKSKLESTTLPGSLPLSSRSKNVLNIVNVPDWVTQIPTSDIDLVSLSDSPPLSNRSVSEMRTSSASDWVSPQPQSELQPASWSRSLPLPNRSTSMTTISPNIPDWAASPPYSSPYKPQELYNPPHSQMVELSQKQSFTIHPVQNPMSTSTGIRQTRWNWTNYGNNVVNPCSQNWIQRLAEPSPAAATPPLAPYFPSTGTNFTNTNIPGDIYPSSPCKYKLIDQFHQQQSPVDQNNLSPISVTGWLEQQKYQGCRTSPLDNSHQYPPPPEYTPYPNNQIRLWNDNSRNMNINSQIYPNQRYPYRLYGTSTAATRTTACPPLPNFRNSCNNLSMGGRFNVQFDKSIPESIPSIPNYGEFGNRMPQFSSGPIHQGYNHQGSSEPLNIGYHGQGQTITPEVQISETPTPKICEPPPPEKDLPKFVMIDLSDGLLDYDFDFKFDT